MGYRHNIYTIDFNHALSAAAYGRSSSRQPDLMRSVTEVDQNIGKRVRSVRTSRGISLGELASFVGVSVQQLQKYETGVNRISAGKLITIARGLDVDVLCLLDVEAAVKESSHISDEAFQLATAFDRLSPSSFKKVLHSLVLAAADNAVDKGDDRRRNPEG